jgi:hypothetical protein
MKIIVDKIDEYPGHAISRADVRLILSAVPSSWSEHVKVVRLSSSRSAASVALYAHSASGDALTIASRGRTKERALHCVLAELAAHALGFKHRTFQHLQARYQAKVESLVAPLMDELLPQLSHKVTLVSHEDVA